MYPVFQEYLRNHQPPAVVIWRKYDPFFRVNEAAYYTRDLPNTRSKLLRVLIGCLKQIFDEVLNLIDNFLRLKQVSTVITRFLVACFRSQRQKRAMRCKKSRQHG